MFGDMIPNPIYYQHTETGKEYSHLTGGITWPVLGAQKGCVLIVGATREDTPRFEVMDTFFSDTPRELLRACVQLREKYGFKNCRKLFNLWIGEDRFQTQRYDVNRELESQKHIHLTPPPDFDKQNSDVIYIEQIRSANADGRLIIPSGRVLDSMKAMTLQDASTPLPNTPVAACFGYILHDMLRHKPWHVNTEPAFNLEEDDPNFEGFNLD
jgi:hypothetical protein